MKSKEKIADFCVDHSTALTENGNLPKLPNGLKLPGRNVYAQMHNEKEQEMTSPVNHSEDTQNIIQGEEFIDDDLDSQTLVFPDSPIHFFCFLYILCCLLYRNPHLGTPQHHYLAVTPSGRSGNLNSYRVPLLLMPVSVQSQVSGMSNGRLRQSLRRGFEHQLQRDAQLPG
ncbi:hypothetical protein QYF61_019859 [Mycteria americana]|uniref:Uncharacterized protein n=1 Tax=Mycteria americana TaxID=33587 RepID=A0AAN7RVP1_MYCAM|nr:hypothetical protein QYF61_019859 [Mycteria americana]